MPFQTFELPFFTNLLILLVTARFFGEIVERFKQPALIGEILAGILLGPSVLNLIHRTEEIKVISDLGVFLLVILVGLEINIDDILRSMRGRNIIISLLAFFLPFFAGYFVAHAFHLPLMSAVFVGLCVAVTALPVSIRILMDLGQIQSEAGQKIISVAIFDDVLALTILGVLLNLKGSDMSTETILKTSAWSFLKLIGFISVLSLLYLLIRKLTHKGNYLEVALNRLLEFMKGREPLFAIFFAFILLFATISELIGFHFIIGAFVAALLISEDMIGRDNLKTIESTTSSIAMGFLTPIFFAGFGLEFNVQSFHQVALLVAILFVSFSSKIVGGYVGGRLAGLSTPLSLTIGIGLNARGIMQLVIANIAYKAGIIGSELFSMLILMGVLTTMSTPLLLGRCFKWLDRHKTDSQGPGVL
ncbi:MAG: cation:proton antiporter [Chitinophagaceae bacterium]|nr:cation:proton antiporter [Chitinophagaceae bacterium]